MDSSNGLLFGKKTVVKIDLQSKSIDESADKEFVQSDSLDVGLFIHLRYSNIFFARESISANKGSLKAKQLEQAIAGKTFTMDEADSIIKKHSKGAITKLIVNMSPKQKQDLLMDSSKRDPVLLEITDNGGKSFLN